jgi:hypothetical protein
VSFSLPAERGEGRGDGAMSSVFMRYLLSVCFGWPAAPCRWLAAIAFTLYGCHGVTLRSHAVTPLQSNVRQGWLSPPMAATAPGRLRLVPSTRQSTPPPLPQSQRDCIPQPRVGSAGHRGASLPWVHAEIGPQPCWQPTREPASRPKWSESLQHRIRQSLTTQPHLPIRAKNITSSRTDPFPTPFRLKE